MLNRRLLVAGGAGALALAAALPFVGRATATGGGEVNLYTYRQEVLIRPLLEAFTKETGIKVNVVYIKEGLEERLRAEGPQSPADAVLTVDVGRLIWLERNGLLQPIKSPALEAAIPAQYRHPDGMWFGVSMRARPIMVNPAKVKPGEIARYEDLADPKWKGRICVRSSGNIYNVSMLAALIAHLGQAKAEAWTRGLVANLARPPAGGDRDQIAAVAAGVCDIAIANTYYLFGMAASKDEKDRAAAAKVKVVWPNQDDRGVHVNLSGAAVTKSAKNRDAARRLVEFLAGDTAQRLYAESVMEYPVKPGVARAAIVAAAGTFKADTLPLASIADWQMEALKIADRAGWR
jgi:iron(III) transport system substrate-binding protein